MAIDFTRVTREIQPNLERLRGEGENLLSSAASQAELSLQQTLNSASNTVISVTNQISSVGAQVESATGSFTDSLPTGNIQNFGAASAQSLLQRGAGASSAMQALGQTENQLKAYASYNYIITLACLTVNEINFPDTTYRVRPPQVSVLRSGGGTLNKAQTAYESSDAQLEYFIDEVEIEGIIAPTGKTRSTNATVMSFTVHEPYSMGLFMQTLMIAAVKAGHADYLKAPYALIIEFKGWDDAGNPLDTGLTTRRVFPISINTMDFDVTSGGSSYRITANAWNETAFSSVAQRTQSDVILQGNNLLELLQTGPNSLTSIMNKRIRERDEDGTAINRDEYVIMFPPGLTSSLGISNQVGTNTDSSAAMTEEEFYTALTGNIDISGIDPALIEQDQQAAYQQYLEVSASRNNVSATIRRVAENLATTNDIGKSTIDSGMVTGGAVPFGQEAFTYDQRTGIYRSDAVTISRDFRTFQFPSGTRVEDIIEELVILSTYGQKAATEIPPDADGMITWYRVHAQTFLSPDEEIRNRSGQNPKVYVYAVVPYRVHSSTFSNASQPSVGIEQRKSAAAKTYDYIYTGQNDDIIDFEINFNTAFYAALDSNINGAGGTRTSTRDGAGASETPQFDNAQGAEGVRSLNSDRAVAEDPTASTTGQAGGSDADTPAVRVARMFNEAIVNNDTDMIMMDLTIMGDPYYLADSGQGNYNSPPLALAYTQDGTMDYQRSEVEVLVNFRTPIDYNTDDGTMIFPQDTIPVKAFSGLYKVNIVRNRFSEGKFTQVLELIRRNKQDDDTGVTGTPDQARAVESTDGDNTTRTDTQNPPPAGPGGNGGV